MAERFAALNDGGHNRQNSTLVSYNNPKEESDTFRLNAQKISTGGYSVQAADRQPFSENDNNKGASVTANLNFSKPGQNDDRFKFYEDQFRKQFEVDSSQYQFKENDLNQSTGANQYHRVKHDRQTE